MTAALLEKPAKSRGRIEKPAKGRRRKPMTDAQREAWKAERKATAERLHADIAERVLALRDSDEWRRYLEFMGSFHKYSINNIMLILAQCPTASRVAGFRQWIEKGRAVRKGEKSIKIYGYATKKFETEDAETGETVEGKRVIFPIWTVFDISQTDPIPGQDDPLTVLPTKLGGEDVDGIGDRVAAYLASIGWTVRTATGQDGIGQANGYTDAKAREVVLAPTLAPAQRAKTLIHEAAHILLHVDADDPKLTLRTYAEHRGLAETEAESVAYVLARLLGLDSSSYSIGYVAGWSEGDEKMLRGTATSVLSAVHTLADALEVAA